MTLCSECRREVLPVVAVDVDGNLTKYHREIQRHCERYWGLTPRSDMEDWHGEGNFEDWLGITQAQYREAKLAFRQGGFKRWARPHAGAVEFMYWLAEQDVEIWITTTRPWNRLDNVDPDTRWWLDHNIPRYDHLLYHDHKYLELAKIVDPSRMLVVVDDLPEMVYEAQEAFGHHAAVLMKRPHNEWAVPGNINVVSNFEMLQLYIHLRAPEVIRP